MLIVSDDQGYANIGYHNSTVLTPRIDAIAKNGVILEGYYVQYGAPPQPWQPPDCSRGRRMKHRSIKCVSTVVHLSIMLTHRSLSLCTRLPLFPTTGPYVRQRGLR